MSTVREFVHLSGGERLSCCEVSPAGSLVRDERVLIMHGAGTSSKARSLPLAEDFADLGFRALAFDFSGHGGSSGTLPELSLRRRFRQALGVLASFAADGGPVVLVGFSMSGQTVADLVERLGDRIRTICLCAPAVYAQDAWSVSFGADFTSAIRKPRSWEDSSAFKIYAGFSGRAVLVTPEHDAVIPSGVTSRLEECLRRNSAFSRLVLRGADHGLGVWLAGHPGQRRVLANLVSSAVPPLDEEVRAALSTTG